MRNGIAMVVAAVMAGAAAARAEEPLTKEAERAEEDYRLDEPQYAFYHDDGTGRSLGEPTRGGQFRDVARWVPRPRAADAPTMQPLK